MNFGEALEALKDGKRICRKGWIDKTMWLGLESPKIASRMNLPYIFVYTKPGVFKKNVVPWVATQADILSEDWYIPS